MIRRLKIYSSLLLIALVLGNCASQSIDHPQEMSEGEIEFEVTYPGFDSNSLVLEVLPTTITLVFKDNKIKTTFSAAAGLFQLSVISDGKSKQLINSVKLFGDKYAFVTTETEPFRVGSSLAPVTIQPVQKRMNLANLECDALSVQCKALTNAEFFVTDQIKVENPNWFTVYSEVPNFLMEYTIEQYDILMHLKAKSVEAKEISDEEFKLEGEAKMLTEKEFDELIITNLKVMLDGF